MDPEGETAVVRGEWRGSVVTEPRGAAGFGYDPLFVPDDEAAGGRTSAELAAEETRSATVARRWRSCSRCCAR